MSMFEFILGLIFLPLGGRAYQLEDIQGVTVIKESFPTTQENVEFGTGYNSLKLQRTYNNPVNVQSVNKELQSNGYISVNYKIKVCKDSSEFFRAFSGGLSASGSYMGVTGSASVKFLTETKITSLDTVLIAHVDAITDTERVGSATFTDAAKKLLDDGDYGQFVETYGTHYLRKIILGGKMMLVLKFTSSSTDSKNEVETKLGAAAGTFKGEAAFSAKMKDIQSSSKLQVSLYASGGNTVPPSTDIDACIKFASDFAKSVQTYSAVREVEFAALWTLPGIPADFKKFLFPLQGLTDKLVHVSVDLLKEKSRVEDMLTQKNLDLAFVTAHSWKVINEVGQKAKKLRENLQRAFKTEPATQYKDIVAKYKDEAPAIDAKLNQILELERIYRPKETIYLKNVGSGLFVSTADGDYPRMDKLSPIPLLMGSPGMQSVPIGGSDYIVIRHASHPKLHLCMTKTSNYVFWEESSDTDCQWRIALVNTANIDRKTLNYGDRIVIYNRYWSTWIMGLSDDWDWVACKEDKHIDDINQQWFIEKSR